MQLGLTLFAENHLRPIRHGTSQRFDRDYENRIAVTGCDACPTVSSHDQGGCGGRVQRNSNRSQAGRRVERTGTVVYLAGDQVIEWSK